MAQVLIRLVNYSDIGSVADQQGTNRHTFEENSVWNEDAYWLNTFAVYLTSK